MFSLGTGARARSAASAAEAVRAGLAGSIVSCGGSAFSCSLKASTLLDSRTRDAPSTIAVTVRTKTAMIPTSRMTA